MCYRLQFFIKNIIWSSRLFSHFYFYFKKCYLLLVFKDFYLFIFRERGREGGREGEKHQCVVASQAHYGNLACNPGVCPDWESNQRPFGSQASTQFTEPHQPGHIRYIFSIILFNGLMAFNLIKVLWFS